jgi:hypothetical protein
MKKTLILIFSIVALSSAKSQVQFGVKAGMNLANLMVSPSDPETSYGSLTSFNGGLLASLPIADALTVQPEINYSGQGSKVSGGGSSGTINYDYINVPVLIKYNHSSGLFAETGPQAGFLISAKAKVDGQSIDIKDGVESFDFSWAFGLGYKIPDVNLGIDIRYNLGITNTDKPISGSNSDFKVKNSVFQFGIFYLFGGASK